ncbi:PadR family transcriptional regulator [Micromonospora echinospora]|uniref:PadR family transcriptional regulator, regulatory protein PadR n=1 Tax=Micromonospora echinospora TaxID=1877 RepID=A0A1C4ZWI7_MICEC|nr:PadR family transcriptional regulator [Micromonospora echinospora]OZV75724.1 PadR family transcriptional regulator [Micromonospora echinospora]SCF37328.1 PadR family transcriptional regulator, regulatory protein PadR [Micromonospora echinospora]
MIGATRGSDDSAERQAQLLRGCLDMCLLALLAAEPAHGYELVHRLDAAGFGTVSYGTVYPLITRLHRLGLVVNVLQPSPSGPPRKVYRLTDTGHDRLRAWREQWAQFASVVNHTVRPPIPGDDHEHVDAGR